MINTWTFIENYALTDKIGSFLTVATYITLIRLFIGPIFLFVYRDHEALNISFVDLPYVLMGLLILSELSDAFDGHVARKYDQVTDLGKILDPMADSIYRISIFLTFTVPPIHLPMGLIFIFLYRDMIISTLRTVCALKGFALAARMSGKLKAVIQAIALFTVLIAYIPYTKETLSIESLQLVSFWAVLLAAIYTVFSGFDYIYANRHYIKNSLSSVSQEEI